MLLCQAGQLTPLGLAKRSFPGHTGLPPAPHGDLAGSFPSRGLALGLADRLKDVQYNKEKATQHLDRDILNSKWERLANIVSIVCSCQWGLNDKTQRASSHDNRCPIDMRPRCKGCLQNCVKVNNEVWMAYFIVLLSCICSLVL